MLQKGARYWASALGVTVAVGAAGAAWRYGGAFPHNIAPPQLLAPPPVAGSDAPPKNAAVTASITPEPAATVAPKPPAPPAEKEAQRPQFDIVRVEPSGEAVIAGRAAPKAKVALTDQGRVVAEANADDAGEFAMVPPPFAPGGHSLGLTSSLDGGKPVEASAPTSIDVPQPSPPKAATPSPPSSGRPAPAQPNGVAKPAVAGEAAKPAPAVVATRSETPAEPAPSEPARRVVVYGVSVEDAGRLVVNGAASAGAFLRLYLNGTFLASVVAGADGRWSLTVQHGMKGGAYAVRADQIDRAKDAVISRAEVPFNYPERLASQAPDAKAAAPASAKPLAPAATAGPAAAPSMRALAQAAQTPQQAAPAPPKDAATATPPPVASAAPATAAAPPKDAATANPPAVASAAPAPAPANAVVQEIDTTKVIRGDSLWRISTQHYGNGIRYKQIYAANAAQIRNPHLIYPGQIFVLPRPTAF
jgi:hypothetical protein